MGSRSKDSQTPLTDNNKLELKLNIKDLETIQDSFSMKGIGYNNLISLSRDEFVEALGIILCKGSREEFLDLFDKIDITREGSVDWDKFASHMLLDFYEKDDRSKSSSIPQWKELKTLIGPHKDIIQKIIHMKNFNRYLTISKEGNVGLWGSDLKLQSSVKTSTDSCRPRDLWVTDFVYMQNVNKIAVSFTSKEIDFYDMGLKLEMVCKIRLENIFRIPMCMDYWYHPDNTGEAMLIWGDTEGFINVLSWTAITNSVFERTTAKSSDKDENLLMINLKEIIGLKFRSVIYFSQKAHQDWIRKVVYIPNLECFISCATNWNTSMVICWLEKSTPTSFTYTDDLQHQRSIPKTSVFSVHQGINSFTYNETINLIATAGVNFHVCLWNPYVISKPNGLLRGHMAPVTDVQFFKARGLLFSFSKDKVLRIWDVQLQICLHRLAGVFPKGQEGVLTNPRIILYSKMYFNEDKMRLFITFNFGLTMLEMKPDIKDRIFSHQKPLIGCLYNSLYNQIVTGCTGGIIYCWMVDTGQRVKTISDICGPGVEMTCITQDISQTRIYTGCTDGNVKIYDFNGHCYTTLICDHGNPADIGQIVILKRCILVFGFSKLITAFWTSNLKDQKVYPSEWKGTITHNDDILSGSSIPPHAVATGSYDGEIIIWNINSEQASRVLDQRSEKSMRAIRENVEKQQAELALKKETFHEDRTPAFNMSKEENVTPIKESSITSEETSSLSSTSSNESSSTDTVSEMSISWTNLCPDCSGAGIYLKKDCLFNVSRLIYLESRKKVRLEHKGADLVSCGGNGVVRFWNFSDGSLIGEFVAHPNASSIIMNIDTFNNEYLATGDTDGNIKLWNITNYCLNDGVNSSLMLLPPLISEWQAHIDEVSGIAFCKRYGRILLITCSADQSAALWEITGVLVGRLGQEQRWKLGNVAEGPMTIQAEIEEDLSDEQDLTTFQIDPDWQPDPEATKNPADYRINVWNNTILGKDYQELRVTKRERIQPKSMKDLPFLSGEKLGRPTFGPFYSLKTSDFVDIEELEYPEFMDFPDKYFRETEDYLKRTARVPLLTEKQRNKSNVGYSDRDLFNLNCNINNIENKIKALNAVFDERCIFNKDFEIKSRYKVTIQDNNQSRLHPIHESSKSKVKIAGYQK